MASVLLSASVERCFVSRMRDFFNPFPGIFVGLANFNLLQNTFVCLVCLYCYYIWNNLAISTLVGAFYCFFVIHWFQRVILLLYRIFSQFVLALTAVTHGLVSVLGETFAVTNHGNTGAGKLLLTSQWKCMNFCFFFFLLNRQCSVSYVLYICLFKYLTSKLLSLQ